MMTKTNQLIECVHDRGSFPLLPHNTCKLTYLMILSVIVKLFVISRKINQLLQHLYGEKSSPSPTYQDLLSFTYAFSNLSYVRPVTICFKLTCKQSVSFVIHLV